MTYDAGAQAYEQIRELDATTTPDPTPEPYTVAEFEALARSIWALEDNDPTRFDELLHQALAFIGRIAIDGANGFEETRAAQLLRQMQARVDDGPEPPHTLEHL